MLFAYPPASAYGRVLPKTKIYEFGAPSSAIKALFVQQVEQIVWQYKLAPSTTNLPATLAVPEIQIFTIHLKPHVQELHEEVLRCIDKAIPLPILFELRTVCTNNPSSPEARNTANTNTKQGDQVKITAAYKRPSEAGSKQWVLSHYLSSAWQAADAAKQPLPVALNLASLYQQLLLPLASHALRKSESLQTFMERLVVISIAERELQKLNGALKKEKQFNRKVGINTQIRALQHSLAQLLGE